MTQGFEVSFNARKNATAANFVAFGIKINTTVVVEAATAAGSVTASSTTQQAEDGMGVFQCTPRSASTYLNGTISYGVFRNSSTGSATTTPRFANAGTAAVPNATITAIAIRAINDTSTNGAEVTSIRILTGSV